MGGSGFEKLKELVDHFDNNLAQIKSNQYNETQARREFIDPFFTLLGWDMDNKQGYAEAYKDVIHEDAIKVGGFTKAPDYCFRIGGTRKFFVEAKKPGINIKEDIDPAYQLRRYAWSAKLPLSILTDFEEFAVYDCRMKPNPTEKASTGRVKYLSYAEYLKNWEELVATFSREAVLKGSFDKYVESNKAKKGTAEVDKAFLIEIEAWRETLARNIAVRNPRLSTRELNYAVQSTIDRIIFLRICEDRGVEDYARLMGLLNGEGVYPRLMQNFREADERYNSGLFHFEPEKGRETHDTLTPGLAIDDKPLKDMIKRLYYPESPYEFSVIPADILGQVYEQFLGKVIRLTAGHQAKVEDKPEVKKAGGVYYTPTYIVDYIVKNTVGKILEGKTPAEVSKVDHPIRILDPACGSGSFLLGAYEFLLTWYRDEYIKAGPAKYSKGKEPKLYQAQGGQWKLTTSERKRILLNHIYGVDIDSQAVEVTKLSLLLKVLEGETKETVNTQRMLFKERALPDLSKNIKCGNSLIGSDFYKDKQGDLFNEEEMIKINAFDWEEEFPEIFKRKEGNGGFDAVIGNPPYRMLQPHNTELPLLEYYRHNYVAAEFKIEIFHLFVQQGMNLLREGGTQGYIMPTTLLNNVYAENLRKWLLERCVLESISVAKGKVFENADVHTSVIIFRREKDPRARNNHKILTDSQLDARTNNSPIEPSSVKQKTFSALPGNVWNILLSEINVSLIERLTKSYALLKDVAVINRGLITGDRSKYFTKTKESELHIAILTGSDVDRYSDCQPSEYVLFERPETAGGCWDREMHLAAHKIVIRQIGLKPAASIIEAPIAVTGNIFTIRTDDVEKEKFILGIINSRLICFFWKIMFTDFKTSFPQVTIASLSQIPICLAEMSVAQDASRHSQIVSLVSSMLSLHKKLQSVKTEQDRTFIQRQIASTDREIDRLVYELYGLNEEEIKIVEGER